ncbi:HAMP domain-containing histidine kinase [Actinoplanes sp. NBC_00393]|uniref:sensor histidine kinase n=1 Tax=Actinoplanes sp. NBC_00393 TaxID=2975953 RepID=UPI002E228D28
MSLRTRLLLITAVLLVAGIVVSDAVVTAALRRHLVDRVDRQVQQFSQVMARLDPNVLDVAMNAPIRNLASGLDLISVLAVAYLDADGTVLRAAQTSTDEPAPAFAAMPPGGPRTVDGWRAVAVARPDGTGIVVVAASLSAVDAIVAEVRLVCLVTGLIVVVVLTGVGWPAIRAGLRPLRSIEQTAGAIAAGNLAERIPERGPPGTEVARLTRVLNGAFAARAASEARMRRFVADVSHELRTPLFGIKGSAELHLMRGAATPGQVDDTMRRIDTEAGRLAALVEDLLLLARLDEPAAGTVLDPAPMDLRTLAADARHDLLALDPGRPVRLTGPSPDDPPAPALVLGDEARLRQVVVNLVGNVHAHTGPDVAVRIGVGRIGDEAVLEIADRGPGLPEAQAERVFERFYRADDSRARGATSGAGLGLAIVRSLVTAHGGRVEAVPTPGGGATFRLCLPWHAAEDSQEP